MILSKRQLTQIIRENLQINEVESYYPDYEWRVSKPETFSFFRSERSSNEMEITTRYELRDFKAGYIGKPLQKMSIDKFTPNYKKGTLKIDFNIPGKVYGKNDYTVNLDLKNITIQEIIDREQGIYFKYKYDTYDKKTVIFPMEKATFIPSKPWGQSPTESDDSRFFQFLLLAIYFGENNIKDASLNDPDDVAKYLNANLKEHPTGFDGKLGPKTTKTWEDFVDKYFSKLGLITTTMKKSMMEKPDGTEITSKELKDIKTLGKHINVGQLFYMIDEAVPIEKLSGNMDTADLVLAANKAGIPVPVQWSKGNYNPSFDELD